MAGQRKAIREPRLDEAMAFVFSAWSNGLWIALERGAPSLVEAPGWLGPRAEKSLFQGRLEALAPEVRDILSGNRKDWAERREEAALHPVIRDGVLVSTAFVLLSQRRAIGPAFLVDAHGVVPPAVLACNGIILSQSTARDRGAVAAWLHAAGLLRHDMLYIEVPDRPGEDYRDVISGSHWLRSSHRPAPDDAVGQALLTAMQARSFRKDAIKASRAVWYQANAVAETARRDGVSGEEAARRLDIPWAQVSNWAQKLIARPARRNTARRAPANHADAIDAGNGSANARGAESKAPGVAMAGKPATEKQAALIQKITAEHPILAGFFAAADWRADRQLASTLIGGALEIADDLRREADNHRRNQRTILARIGYDPDKAA